MNESDKKLNNIIEEIKSWYFEKCSEVQDLNLEIASLKEQLKNRK